MRDLAALNRWIDDFERKQSRLYAAADLESSSVTNGRLRFIGGLLRVDSGGRVEIVGTLQIDGTTTVRGQFNVEGPWNLTGGGTISGDVTITGKVTQVGDMDIDGVLTVNGDGWSITGNGEISGDVQLTGRLSVGDMLIDPDDAGGSVVFPSGAKVTANDGSPGVKIESGTNWAAYVAQNGIRMGGTIGDASLTLTPELLALGADRVQVSAPDLVLGTGTANVDDITHWLGRTASGEARWVSKGQGGPMGSGEFRWPFPLTLVTQEYDPFAEGYPNGHLGIDFGNGVANIAGTPVQAASGGTVLTTEWDDERGWQVILDHGDRGGFRLTTRYYHLRFRSHLEVGATVALGEAIGQVGDTGYSRGVHLHFETRRDGAPMNPRQFMAIYGQ